jgi:RimJ/RimL family protein N-acetyltransferase
MISLRRSRRDELEVFDQMDRQAHASEYVIQTGIDTHRNNFDDPRISYLSIENAGGEFCGYFILVLEADNDGVEFRRILIDGQQRGIGQAAIGAMESYCKKEFKIKRIWLDVYEDNEVGVHIYEKLGYTRFEEEYVDGRKLYLYEKIL